METETGQYNYSKPSGGTATFLVAASDAPAEVKARADYVCDGTADDVQIQSAIDALGTVGGTVYLTEGAFDISAKVNLDSKITFKGSGHATILNASDSLDETMLEADTKTDVIVCGLAIDGTGQTGTSYGLSFKASSQFAAKNLYVHNTAKDGVRVESSNHGIVENLILVDIGNHAVFAGYASHDVVINNVVSTNPGTEHVCIEWRKDSVDNYNINVSNVTGYDAHNTGIYVQHAHNIVVSNCTIQNTANYGIYIDDSYRISFNNVVVDTITGADRSCYFDTSAAHHITVSNCQFYNSDAGNGMQISSDNTSITNSMIIDSYKTGINISGATNLSLNNVIVDTSEDVGRFNVSISNAASNIAINNCQFYEPTKYNIFISTADNIIINSCILDGASNAAGPFSLTSDSSRVTFSNCLFRHFTNYSNIKGSNILLHANSWKDPDVSIPRLIYISSGPNDVQIYDNDMDCPTTGDKVSGEAGWEVVTFCRNNLGFNPEGMENPSPDGSPWTYTAGSSAETVYIYNGTVSDISKDSNKLFGETGHTVNLEPHESVVITYSVAPTVRADVH